MFGKVGVSFFNTDFFFKEIVCCMSNLWWCLEICIIMPAYGFSFCPLSAGLAPSLPVSGRPQCRCRIVWALGVMSRISAFALVPSIFLMNSLLLPWKPFPSQSERADKVAFSTSPLHRGITLCVSNLFVIGLLPSQMQSFLRAETFDFSRCQARCCLVASCVWLFATTWAV